MKKTAIRRCLRWLVSLGLVGLGLSAGTTRAFAGISLTPAPLDFGTIAFGTTAVLALTVANDGSSVFAFTTHLNGPSYKVLTTAENTCMGGVAPNASCVLPIEFDPAAVGFHLDQLRLIPIDGPRYAYAAVDLKGAAAGVGTEMETPLEFEPIVVGSSEVLLLTVNNFHMPGTATVATSIDDPSYKVLATAQNTCAAGVATGGSCTLPVEFAPLTPGNHNGTLTLTPSEGAVSTVELRSASETALSNPVAGNIYVLDSLNERIQIFDAKGDYVGQFSHSYHFDITGGIAVDATNVYVTQDCVVQKYDGIGVFISEFGQCNAPPTYAGGPGYFDIASQVGTDSKGNVWVTSPGNGYVQKFDSNGNFLSMFCTVEATSEQVPNCPMETNFDFEPQYITLDANDNLYITNENLSPGDRRTGNFGIVKFDSTGKRIFSLGTVGDVNRQFYEGEPLGIAVDSKENIYASAGEMGNVEIFEKSGPYLGEFHTDDEYNSSYYVTSPYPYGLAFDAEGDLYVVQADNAFVEEYDAKGNLLSYFGAPGHGEGQFFLPLEVAVAK